MEKDIKSAELVHVGTVSDADLVRRCVGPTASSAYAELVQRHGQTVLAVCRGILGQTADADDAFQVTFLVFLRGVERIQNPSAISGWLCGVAVRVAKRIRWQRDQAQAWTKPMTSDSEPLADAPSTTVDAETRATIWEELGQLPEKYRLALVLCHLEERTTEEAAGLLDCPVGTLRSRLVKGRELLRSRLVRRGLVLTSALVLTVLLTDRAAATPPPELLQRTASSTTTVPPLALRQLADRVAQELARKRGWLVGLTLLVTLGSVLIAGVILLQQNPTNSPAEVVGGPGTLLVVSQEDATVTLLDALTGQTRRTIRTDPGPHDVVVSPSGRLAAVASYGPPFAPAFGSTVTLIDVVRGTKLQTVNVGNGSAPHGMAWLNEDRLLCTVEKQESVVEIDVPAGKIARTIRTAQSGTHMVLAARGKAITANTLAHSLSLLDAKTGLLLDHVPVGHSPEGMALSPDGQRLWVGNRGDETISILATDNLKRLKTIPAVGMPIRLAFTPDGTRVAVALHLTGELALFDAHNQLELKRIPLASPKVPIEAPNPASIAISRDGKTAYCTLFTARTVAVVDLVAGELTGKFDLPSNALDGLAFSPITLSEGTS